MLKTRVITAIVMLAVLLPVTLFAPLAAFGALIGAVPCSPRGSGRAC